ncbi:divalent-cation tolerance protein CutA [Qipengyuania huizhouensis]|uniref:divalent-cation tolerance protein CutA n=1 Tax=Qipengyuania huizhouensis TaxID=2867245 RepID=UPI00182EFFFE|nr:divalent cation tolerance protein CutA [Qipengyuania huizhouensis]MBA4763936.1 divalent-cation tolerance protein CutA [Erythrobacter sp.]MBX7459893.1 divalent-cation tolerance protein CutA [Qipengyuania huizhouensis]
MSALIYCPFPDTQSARKIGEQLLDEGLIGCINVGGPIQSLFIWGGEKGEGEEYPALLKTDEDLLELAISRLEELHPYDAPAVLGWQCVAGKAAESWLRNLGGGGNIRH